MKVTCAGHGGTTGLFPTPDTARSRGRSRQGGASGCFGPLFGLLSFPFGMVSVASKQAVFVLYDENNSRQLLFPEPLIGR